MTRLGAGWLMLGLAFACVFCLPGQPQNLGWVVTFCKAIADKGQAGLMLFSIFVVLVIIALVLSILSASRDGLLVVLVVNLVPRIGSSTF